MEIPSKSYTELYIMIFRQDNIMKDIYDMLHVLKSKDGKRLSLCHGDLHLGNFIYNNKSGKFRVRELSL